MFPDRWHDYTACGGVIEGTKILCFKTPLNAELFEYVTNDEDRWTVAKLLANGALGAVIDLTNTTRYYDGAEIMRAGVLHRKIRVPGRAIPDESAVKKFCDTVDEFRKKCPTMLIGVHCTHGVNRSGYLVCRYMIDKLGVAPSDAIARFETARGHKIERDNYSQTLLARTNSNKFIEANNN
ncbi:Protein tyrosine phosphatase 1 [Hyphantria cunea nucleopolyhedrovirus]|uniref:Protein tyrosine phosphatase 1 n=1 Tax=Hyphantria cunea nuclear polyhedrosis virus TaxID=28288 RepID=Q2NP56_NPVHC|nr:Protein tyrosine phosphatase 1 [Hyphantria cunea nucleopolyhedrovirus]BAE72431.1 Protein tyrosine phosphatase 1 [Hyphantria cunea nucleopolyhedrovirus]